MGNLKMNMGRHVRLVGISLRDILSDSDHIALRYIFLFEFEISIEIKQLDGHQFASNFNTGERALAVRSSDSDQFTGYRGNNRLSRLAKKINAGVFPVPPWRSIISTTCAIVTDPEPGGADDVAVIFQPFDLVKALFHGFRTWLR